MVPDDAARVISEGLDLFNQGEYERSIATLPPEIEWDTSQAVPDGGLHRGRDDVLAYWRGVGARWVEFRIEPERVRERPNVVLVQGRLCARGADSGVPVEGVWDQVWRIAVDVPIRCENYTDRALALRVAGLEPEDEE